VTPSLFRNAAAKWKHEVAGRENIQPGQVCGTTENLKCEAGLKPIEPTPPFQPQKSKTPACDPYVQQRLYDAIKTSNRKGIKTSVELDNGSLVQVNADDNDMNALHYAAQKGSFWVVQYLIQKGANPELKTRDGKTALDFAANQEIHEAILSAQAQ
jgi:ankyrin repeat protein